MDSAADAPEEEFSNWPTEECPLMCGLDLIDCLISGGGDLIIEGQCQDRYDGCVYDCS